MAVRNKNSRDKSTEPVCGHNKKCNTGRRNGDANVNDASAIYSDVVVVVVVVVLGSSAILFLVSAARFPLAAFSRKIQKRRESRSVPFILSLSLSLSLSRFGRPRQTDQNGISGPHTERPFGDESNRIESHRIESRASESPPIALSSRFLVFSFFFYSPK